jgi:acyl-CoA reductase-like NAD-dependent aldehyde dehydrogenase
MGDLGEVADAARTILNIVGGETADSAPAATFEKVRPADGTLLCRVARSGAADVDAAVAAARRAQPDWAERTPVERGDIVRDIAVALREQREQLSAVVAEETGKPMALALGETDAAIEMGFFVAGEGRRSYGRTMPASMAHRAVSTMRRPVGVAGLIASFNTPLPNIAWKAFPAVFCGNAAVFKPSEHVPASAHDFATVCCKVGLPPGVLNVVQGLGHEAGAALVAHPDVDLVSFTGSAVTGRSVNEAAASRLAKVCLELGGKNALVVCDDADLERAAEWALASAFSNAGQRCAAASRIVVFDAVYDEFRRRFVESARGLDPQPVISEEALARQLEAIRASTGTLLAGGDRLDRPGWFLPPTILEGVAPDAEISCTELFGPVAILYRVGGFEDALVHVNDSPYGLTAAIHTASVHRAMRFAELVRAGVVVVNGGTHGSEPHMGFGGVKQSGTGWKEAGVEALDVYSDVVYVNVVSDPARV